MSFGDVFRQANNDIFALLGDDAVFFVAEGRTVLGFWENDRLDALSVIGRAPRFHIKDDEFPTAPARDTAVTYKGVNYLVKKHEHAEEGRITLFLEEQP
ncbi:MAG: hypothetical protein ACR2RB_16030 [Gammaproteobacteria bacterium]